MHTATARFGLLAFLVLLASPAWAQEEYEITFQVDMTAAIDNCAFTPDEGTVTVPGNFNGWDNTAFPLADGDGDGIYGGTYTIAETDLVDPDGEMAWKYYATPDNLVGWEDDPNRTLDPTEDTTLDPVAFNKTFEDLCTAETETYEIVFQVDMSVATLQGQFDPETDVVTVAGTFDGWDAVSDTLVQDIFNPDVYIGIVESEVVVPSEQLYKFIIGEPEDAAPDGWESIGDRPFMITGDETDSDGDDNDFPEKVLDVVYYNDVTPDDILTEPATVTFEVDLRAAYYYLEDNGELPSDTQTGDPVESIDGLFINGPVAGNADGLNDWATWGPDDLGQIESRELVDDGTNGDAMAGDSVFTLVYEYPAGTAKNLIGKFGINGFDNEGGFGANQNFAISEGTLTLDAIFGAIRQADGTFTDDNGPVINDDDFSMAYDPYILIDNDATPPTAMIVRSGGEADNEGTSVEGTGVVPATAELRGNFPNPFASRTTFEYAIADAGHVSLTVYDLMGRRVATLVDGTQAADTYRVAFDASDLASGVYIVRLMVGDTVQSQKLTVTN